MAIFLADMPPLPPRPPKQHAQISWLAKGGRFYLFSLSRRSRGETSFGSCSGGAEVAPLALLASLGLTTTLVHEKKHEGQHRGKNDRRASQDIKVVARTTSRAPTTAGTYRHLAHLLHRRRRVPPNAAADVRRSTRRPSCDRPIARGPRPVDCAWQSTANEAHEPPT